MQKNNVKNKLTTIKLGLAGAIFSVTLFLSAVANADSYVVQSGDTLSEIASTHHTTTEQLLSSNHIADADFITVGQVLEISTTNKQTPETVTTTATSYSSNLSASDSTAKEIIAQRESSGSYTARNGQYYGRYQLSISYLGGDLSAENQERVADAYVASRYGSWSAALAFWNANGWY